MSDPFFDLLSRRSSRAGGRRKRSAENEAPEPFTPSLFDAEPPAAPEAGTSGNKRGRAASSTTPVAPEAEASSERRTAPMPTPEPVAPKPEEEVPSQNEAPYSAAQPTASHSRPEEVDGDLFAESANSPEEHARPEPEIPVSQEEAADAEGPPNAASEDGPSLLAGVIEAPPTVQSLLSERITQEDISEQEELRRKALKMFQRGIGYKIAAANLGIPAYTVRDWGRAYRNGTFTITPKKFGKRYSQEERANVLSLRAEGLTWREIEKATGIPKQTCQAWVRRQKQSSG